MRRIGDQEKCFITFEAGPTHNGLETAKGLAEVAANAGGDAIKFQIVDADKLVSDREQMFSYDILVDKNTGETKTVSEPLYDLLKRRMLSHKEWLELKKYCDKLGLAFFATVTFEEELELVKQMNCDTIKIASADINHFPFLRLAARTGLNVQIDTGNATMGDVEAAVDVIRSEGNNDIIIHHCPPGYPAIPSAINLRVIPTLKNIYNLPVAYSDHSPGWDKTIAAIALGANLVEKTITFDRTTRSVEHMFSLEPNDATEFVKTVREVGLALGGPRRIMTPEERKHRVAYRRSTFLAADAPAGTNVKDLKVDFRRPGWGMGPDEFERCADMKLRQPLPKGHMLAQSDIG
ncbi:MAG: N-acetylneuraminate synthase family protein [Xanthobacteraceae bacterium]|nr:N-acetylneuraminate synthase family protein [Xanthobacteraceae bacterium]